MSSQIATTKTPPRSLQTTDTTEDGYVYDVETGEILGLATDQPTETQEEPRPFRVESPEAADWVLRMIAAEEAKLLAIESQKAALLANLDAIAVDPRVRLSYLTYRFRAEMIEQAQRDIAAAGGRTKTAKYPHGRVSFRSTGAKFEITDMAGAVEFVESVEPTAIKKTVGVTEVKAAVERLRQTFGEEPETSGWCKIRGPEESATITTGIGKDSK